VVGSKYLGGAEAWWSRLVSLLGLVWLKHTRLVGCSFGLLGRIGMARYGELGS
jgi:hypothetical protein